MRLTPRTVRAGIARLESSPFIRSDIAHIKDRLALQQHKVNKAILARVRKQEQLVTLQEQLRMLEISTVCLSEDDVCKKESDLSKLESRVEYEEAISDSLAHMIHTRKSALLFVKKSITILKTQLAKETAGVRTSLALDGLMHDAQNAVSDELRTLTVQRQRANSDLKRATASSYDELRSRNKLRMLLEHERNFQTEASKTKSGWDRLQALEKDLVKAQGNPQAEDEALASEVQLLTQRCDSEDQKFRTLQLVSSVKSASELESYWAGVQVSRYELESAVTAAQKKIDNLNDARKDAEAELRSLRTSEDEFNPMLLEILQDKLKDSAKRLQMAVGRHAVMREIIVAATNIFSRIRRRLVDDTEELLEQDLPGGIMLCGDVLVEILALKIVPRSPRCDQREDSDVPEALSLFRGRGKGKTSKNSLIESHRVSRITPSRRGTVKQ